LLTPADDTEAEGREGATDGAGEEQTLMIVGVLEFSTKAGECVDLESASMEYAFLEIIGEIDYL
jgi:hypothetical protein